MKNTLSKIKVLIGILETPDLNAIDCITIIKSIVQTLQTNSDDSAGMDNLIRSSITFAEKMGINAEADFRKYHRKRRKDEIAQ